MIKGIDISHWQGKMDFDSLKDLIKFIIIKATEGNGGLDSEFSRNQLEARRVGLPIGYYHFARPDLNNTAEAEAQYFVKTIGELKEGEVLALDYESSWSGDVVTWCYQFLNKVFSLTGVRPLIYLNQSLMKSHDWSKVFNENFGLWLAVYDGNSSIPSTPWPTLAMKQFTNCLPILNQKVDGDYFMGDVDTFKKYGYKIAVVTTPETTNDDDDTKRALETLTAYKVAQNHSNLQGAINDLIGKANDLINANKKIDELQKKIDDLEAKDGTNSNSGVDCQTNTNSANENGDIVEENNDTVDPVITSEQTLNIINQIIGFFKNLFIKK